MLPPDRMVITLNRLAVVSKMSFPKWSSAIAMQAYKPQSHVLLRQPDAITNYSQKLLQIQTEPPYMCKKFCVQCVLCWNSILQPPQGPRSVHTMRRTKRRNNINEVGFILAPSRLPLLKADDCDSQHKNFPRIHVHGYFP